MSSKSCGGCQHFNKWKNDSIGGGLCRLHDYRTTTDSGRSCNDHKRIPYTRNNKIEIINEDADC